MRDATSGHSIHGVGAKARISADFKDQKSQQGSLSTLSMSEAPHVEFIRTTRLRVLCCGTYP